MHRITLELKERMLRVEKLQNKFETISSKSQNSAEAGEEPKSQAYYVIKAAQVRAGVRRAGAEPGTSLMGGGCMSHTGCVPSVLREAHSLLAYARE